MVEISEVIEDPPPPPPSNDVNKEEKNDSTAAAAVVEEEEEELPSQARLRDADEIASLLPSLTRPSAKAHLDVLMKKLRREGMALQRVEASRAKAASASASASAAAATTTTTTAAESEEKKDEAVVKPAATSTPTPTPTAPPPTTTSAPPKAYSDSLTYVPITKFAFDMGEYNSQFLKLYIDLPQVGTIPKSNISCDFTSDKFDLIVRDLQGRSYRLIKDNLEHDINAAKCKFIVKANKVIVKLAKMETSYGGYDHWSSLTSKKKKSSSTAPSSSSGGGKADAAKDPSASIMALMKDMYDSGDDAMKKMIGETMMKQRRGELDGSPPEFDASKFDAGGGGLGDL